MMFVEERCRGTTSATNDADNDIMMEGVTSNTRMMTLSNINPVVNRDEWMKHLLSWLRIAQHLFYSAVGIGQSMQPRVLLQCTQEELDIKRS